MSGHTPGPWLIGRQLAGNAPSIIAEGDSVVAMLPGQWNGCTYIEANARLIAAAPELLEALAQSVAQMDMAADCLEAGRADEALLHLRSLMRVKRAAISKATGEQP